MFLIDNKNITDPSVNLALEEYCVRNLDMSNDYLLFYINEPSVIIGKHQNTIEEINSGYIKENNIHVVRRISGGGAVYHDYGNLNFSFMTKHSQQSIHNFKLFTGPVIRVLNEMGINAELNGRNDITVSGKKISGNAQFTDTRSMFSHGTLLFDSNLENVFNALNVKADKVESKGIKSIRSRVANIKDYVAGYLTIDDFRATLIENIFDFNLDAGTGHNKILYTLSDADWNEVYKLSDSKYKTWAWNYGRSPEFNVQKIKRFDSGQVDMRLNIKDGIITGCKIYGDFLGHGEIHEFENKLNGVKYEKDSMVEALKNVDPGEYFGNIDADEFISWISD